MSRSPVPERRIDPLVPIDRNIPPVEEIREVEIVDDRPFPPPFDGKNGMNWNLIVPRLELFSKICQLQ